MSIILDVGCVRKALYSEQSGHAGSVVQKRKTTMSTFTAQIVAADNGKADGIELLSIKMPPTVEGESSRVNAAFDDHNDQSSLHNSQTTRDRTVAVLGSGFYGLALVRRLTTSGVNAILGSRHAMDKQTCEAIVEYQKAEVSKCEYEEACRQADIIIMAIPRHSYDAVVPNLADVLHDKIVIDISNRDSVSDECNAIYLSRLLPDSHVVKALNTLSAWSLEQDIFGTTRDTFVCCDHSTSKLIVMDLMRDMGLNPVDRGRLSAANHVEKLPLRLFPEWRLCIVVNIVVMIITSTYHFIRRFAAEKIDTIEHLALHEANYILAWQAITLFSLVYLPGNIASVVQLFRGTKYKEFPVWLDCWMKSRKQIGLSALVFAGMHGCASVLLMAGGYIFRMVRHIPINGNPGLTMYREFTWEGEISLLCAILAITTFTILGITSLPSVNARMSWREWDFVQSFMGYLGLSFGIVHVFVYAHGVYEKERFKFYAWDMPPSVFFMPLLPSFVVAFKFVLLLPCLRYRLIRIRSGRYNKPSVIGSCCC